jgi:hypothetical protein
MQNIIDSAAKVVSIMSSAISMPIVYNHRKNGGITSSSTPNAVVESLENFKIDGDFISSGKRFILSKNENSKFLEFECKRNDTVECDGKVWYVLTSKDSDVDLEIITSIDAFSKTTKKIR